MTFAMPLHFLVPLLFFDRHDSNTILVFCISVINTEEDTPKRIKDSPQNLTIVLNLLHAVFLGHVSNAILLTLFYFFSSVKIH